MSIGIVYAIANIMPTFDGLWSWHSLCNSKDRAKSSESMQIVIVMQMIRIRTDFDTI